VPSCAVPAFPGAQKISGLRESFFNFQHKACSRPPFPITNTFIVRPFVIDAHLAGKQRSEQASDEVKNGRLNRTFRSRFFFLFFTRPLLVGFLFCCARVAKSVDARDLKSLRVCGIR
jgi:hypothetical protein